MKRVAACLVLLTLCLGLAAATPEETVYFNVRSRKYHCLTCYHARHCTANCIEVTISEAKKRGGVPCKICGGTCKPQVGLENPTYARDHSDVVAGAVVASPSAMLRVLRDTAITYA